MDTLFSISFWGWHVIAGLCLLVVIFSSDEVRQGSAVLQTVCNAFILIALWGMRIDNPNDALIIVALVIAFLNGLGGLVTVMQSEDIGSALGTLTNITITVFTIIVFFNHLLT